MPGPSSLWYARLMGYLVFRNVGQSICKLPGGRRYRASRSNGTGYWVDVPDGLEILPGQDVRQPSDAIDRLTDSQLSLLKSRVPGRLTVEEREGDIFAPWKVEAVRPTKVVEPVGELVGDLVGEPVGEQPNKADEPVQTDAPWRKPRGRPRKAQ